MSEPNKAVVRRLEDAFAAGDEATVRELCAPDIVDHNPLPEQKPGLEGYLETAAYYRSVFPDLSLDELTVTGDGDLVATRWRVSGTQREEFFGVPPTGKHVSTEGMNFYRLEDGRIAEVWTQFDGVGLLQQLGALPAG